MTQGQLGSLLGLTLRNACAGRAVRVASLVTHVLVDPADTAFAHPTKPIGPFFPPRQAQALAARRGWTVGEDAGRGYRRLVASPEPQAILEADAIRSLADAGFVVVAAGGGGIPVRSDHGRLTGVEAVVDKDLAAQRLASATGADSLVLVTDVDHVALDFGGAAQRIVQTMTADEADGHLRDGQFPPGSMGPKITAAVRFLRAGGRVAVITSAPHVLAALQGRHGTRIVASRAAAEAVAMTTGRTRLHKDTYLDSVRLLAGSKAMLGVPGVEQATALMGTPANLDQLASDGFDAEALTGAGANDLLLAVRAGSPEAAEAALARAEQAAARGEDGGRAGRGPATTTGPPRTLDEALAALPGANVAVVSVPGPLRRARGAQGAVGGPARPAVQRQRAGRGRGGAQGQGGRAGPAADGPGRRHGDAGRGRARVRQRGRAGAPSASSPPRGPAPRRR